MVKFIIGPKVLVIGPFRCTTYVDSDKNVLEPFCTKMLCDAMRLTGQSRYSICLLYGQVFHTYSTKETKTCQFRNISDSATRFTSCRRFSKFIFVAKNRQPSLVKVGTCKRPLTSQFDPKLIVASRFFSRLLC